MCLGVQILEMDGSLVSEMVRKQRVAVDEKTPPLAMSDRMTLKYHPNLNVKHNTGSTWRFRVKM